MNEHARRAARLARLVRVRELEERIAKARAGEALTRSAAAHGALAAARKDHVGALEDLRARVEPGTLDPLTLMGLERTLPALAGRIARSRERARTADGQADRARAEWLAARAARLGLDRLVERTRALARAEDERVEAALLDETAGVRARERQLRGRLGTTAAPVDPGGGSAVRPPR